MKIFQESGGNIVTGASRCASDLVQLFAITAVPMFGGVGTNVVYQGLIRVLWLMILITFLTFVTKHNLYRRKRNFVLSIGWLISTLSILWNKESAIMVAITFASLYICLIWV